jgi:hypothetical protein
MGVAAMEAVEMVAVKAEVMGAVVGLAVAVEDWVVAEAMVVAVVVVAAKVEEVAVSAVSAGMAEVEAMVEAKAEAAMAAEDLAVMAAAAVGWAAAVAVGNKSGNQEAGYQHVQRVTWCKEHHPQRYPRSSRHPDKLSMRH